MLEAKPQLQDKIVRATGKVAELRMVVVDATDAANTIGSLHGAGPYAHQLMGETTVAALLLATGLKGEGALQVSCRYSGDLTLVTADATPIGLVRAMIPKEDIDRLGGFEPALRPQVLSVRKFNRQAMPISEGVVELPSLRLGPGIASYLLQSEQTRSAVGIAAKIDPNGGGLLYCAGFLVEAFPKADEKTISIMEAVVRDLPDFGHFQRGDGLRGLDANALLDQLAGPFDYQIHREDTVKACCPCNREAVMRSLTSLGQEELRDIANKGEPLEIYCHFCRHRYEVSSEDVEELLNSPGEIPEGDAL